MHKISSVAAVILAASVLAWSEEAADFLLLTCLPAMDDPASVDAMGEANGWTRLPSAGSRWVTSDFIVIAGWNFLRSCRVEIRPFKQVYRDEFFAALSAALELKPTPNISVYRELFGTEIYEIIGDKKLTLYISSDKGIVSAAIIFRAP